MSTSRTDALDKTVQGQNWGYRDMFLLAQKLESELAEAKIEVQELRRQMTVSQIQAAEFEIEAQKAK